MRQDIEGKLELRLLAHKIPPGRSHEQDRVTVVLEAIAWRDAFQVRCQTMTTWLERLTITRTWLMSPIQLLNGKIHIERVSSLQNRVRQTH